MMLMSFVLLNAGGRLSCDRPMGSISGVTIAADPIPVAMRQSLQPIQKCWRRTMRHLPLDILLSDFPLSGPINVAINHTILRATFFGVQIYCALAIQCQARLAPTGVGTLDVDTNCYVLPTGCRSTRIHTPSR